MAASQQTPFFHTSTKIGKGKRGCEHDYKGVDSMCAMRHYSAELSQFCCNL